ncbi:MAG: hypothetical protein K9M45_10105 [Kiritimatiellales bacterium]|nr:hypothetical protein [Kiritimatiellales bacterium]
MNLPKINSGWISAALANLESWLDTVHGPDGYYGPVVGMRGQSLAYCGPGFDWRYEGLLDGWAALYKTTGRAEWLDRMETACREIAAAQLLNGAYRNSYFEDNPFEGGMPYEPAMMAAVCRTRSCLEAAGRGTDAIDLMIERFVERRLVRELWCKSLQTFNNWMQSDFTNYSPAALSDIMEILIAYADLSHEENYVTHYAVGAAQSILGIQAKTGALAGGIPVSRTKRTVYSPFLLARCLPALRMMAERTGDQAYSDAARLAYDFIIGQRLDSGFPLLIHADLPPSIGPRFTGALANIYTCMERAGFDQPVCFTNDFEFILSRQTKRGGFSTAEGFGLRKNAPLPDWRDVMPCAGWNDKIYALLASLHSGKIPRPETSAVVRHVTVSGKPAIYTEDSNRMHIEGEKSGILFDWNKNRAWAEICLL